MSALSVRMCPGQDRFRLPEMHEAARLLTEFHENPASEMLARYALQESTLRQAIESMRTPWLDAHEAMKLLLHVEVKRLVKVIIKRRN
jgi:hypothetical protein